MYDKSVLATEGSSRNGTACRISTIYEVNLIV